MKSDHPKRATNHRPESESHVAIAVVEYKRVRMFRIFGTRSNTPPTSPLWPARRNDRRGRGSKYFARRDPSELGSRSRPRVLGGGAPMRPKPRWRWRKLGARVPARRAGESNRSMCPGQRLSRRAEKGAGRSLVPRPTTPSADRHRVREGREHLDKKRRPRRDRLRRERSPRCG